MKNRLRLRIALRQHTIILSSLLAFVTLGAFLFFLGNHKNSYAAVSGDYRSIATGNWDGTTVWQRFNGTSWVATSTPPTSTNGTITIQSGHVITMVSGLTVDQVVINAGGQFILNSGVTLIVANGTGTDFDVSGTFTNAGTVTINVGAAIAFQSTGKYQHNFTTVAGTIPTASWVAGSTCEVIGYTTNSNAPAGLQAFSNFTWNCPAQTNAINLNGALTTVNGDLRIASTNTSELDLSANGSTLNVGGNYVQTGGKFVLSTNANQSSIMNLTGNFSVSGGTFSLVNGSNSTGTLNLSGNYSHTGGTITEGGNGTTVGQIVFKKSGVQTFTSPANSVFLNVDYTVNNGSVLDISTETMVGRNFTLAAGGGIMSGSVAGISSSGPTGNIQVSGTRTYSTGADYTFDGNVLQIPGTGFPATVRNLTINNNSDLLLSANVAVTGVLTLTSGRIITGIFEVQTTNTSTGSVAGNSNASYVLGNLRRSVAGSGTYTFPLGTSTMYELMSVTLSGTSGFTNLLGTFVNTNPINPSFPLSGLSVSGVGIDMLLNYGYWTLTPNSALTGGTYSVQLNEQGHSNPVTSGCTFCVLVRNNPLTSWQSIGTHNNNTQTVNGGVVTAVRSGINSFYQYGIGYGELLSMSNPSLISGTNGQVGAVYLFPDVCSNVDAWISIVQLSGGATLNSIDDATTGYNEAFQPFIDLAPNTTSSIQWKIVFKVAGTSTDTTLPNLTMTGIDVDGNATMREFVEATMPTSYALGSPTTLTVTNNNGNYRATSGTSNISNIDTSQHQAMYQLNYKNVNSIFYRTGGISTTGSVTTRQTSIYFKSFLSGTIALPVKLLYFNARLEDHQVNLDWATATEINNDFFTIERSYDAITFEQLIRLHGAGNSTLKKTYQANDVHPLDGFSYYRLKQTDYDGRYSYSEIQTIKNGKFSKGQGDNLQIESISPNPFKANFSVGFTMKLLSPVDFTLISSSGKIVEQRKIQPVEGYNSFEFQDPSNLNPGIYFVVLSFEDQKIVRKLVRE